ncbi:ABC transporter family substrate-binding protein [Protaetiibacter intestinalis]|uniref:ABC transporter family substrate-binding protein n=1 Tax=Protaetiibacter intestinalis TaxID=2419774 RepID=A0A387B802_9MICO|nr:ABC transporter family substrate-binding protein [Protaetiibacter intestinalis]AYF98487.1 ABC transporter family substrate-binding protein [Protaetiibacter intestinalis]
MKHSRIAVMAAVAVVAAIPLAGCTESDRVVHGSSVTVAVSGTLTSLNANSSYGRASALDADVAYLTGSSFAYVDGSYQLIEDTSFGTAEITAEDPLTVRYTIADGVNWSDGVPVTPADLLLAWAANSGALDSPDVDVEQYVDPETGRLGELPEGTVYFDGAVGRGLELATQTPQLGDDGRSLFVHYDTFTPGWRTALAPGLPAHIVASRALGMPLRADDAAETADPDGTLAGTAVAALSTAITDADADALTPIADVWNSGFDLTGTAPDPELLVASGPYRVSEVGDGRVTLTVNPAYRGSRAPTIETIVLETVEDPAELVRRVRDGEVDIATPAPDAQLAAELSGIPGVSVAAGSESTFEHLDLQFADSKSGLFSDVRVREAFLHVVPRQQILEELVTPVQADASLLDSFVLRPGAPGYEDAVADNGSDAYRTTDVDAARELLAEAGVPSPEVCILFDPADARRVATFELIQASASRAGFRVTDCSRGDWSSLLGVAGAYDAALFAWDTTRLGPGAVAAVFRSDSTIANLNHFADPEADALVDTVTGTDDQDAQVAALTELDGILWKAAYGVPLYAHPTLTVVSDRVEGVTRSPLARGVLWDAWAWTPATATEPPEG